MENVLDHKVFFPWRIIESARKRNSTIQGKIVKHREYFWKLFCSLGSYLSIIAFQTYHLTSLLMNLCKETLLATKNTDEGIKSTNELK